MKDYSFQSEQEGNIDEIPLKILLLIEELAFLSGHVWISMFKGV